MTMTGAHPALRTSADVALGSMLAISACRAPSKTILFPVPLAVSMTCSSAGKHALAADGLLTQCGRNSTIRWWLACLRRSDDLARLEGAPRIPHAVSPVKGYDHLSGRQEPRW